MERPKLGQALRDRNLSLLKVMQTMGMKGTSSFLYAYQQGHKGINLSTAVGIRDAINQLRPDQTVTLEDII